MQETLGLARLTIRQAMASLENDGLIRRVQGKGNFVEGNARRKLNRGQDIFALVVPVTRADFYPALLHGFETAASDLRHQTIVCSTEDNVERQADIIMQLLDMKVGGVAINPTSPRPTPAYQVRVLQEQGIPVVFCHRRVEGVTAPLLAIPFREAGRLAGKFLTDRGHRRLTFMATYQHTSGQQFADGLNEALLSGEDNAPAETVFIGESSVPQEEDVLLTLQQMFARHDRPTAIVASCDSVAEMIYFLLPRLGLRVPEDVSLVGFGGKWHKGLWNDA